MKAGRPGTHEYELQALLEREFRHGGGRGWGYYPIVAAGENATVLHYNDNCAEVRDGALVLIDAGAESDLYTADVTRTWPASGKFSDPQRACYQLVLDAADACIAATKPGETIDGLHEKAVRILTEGMVRLGLLKGDVDALIKDSSYRRYYMHRTSHWLGLDVHDVGSYRPSTASRARSRRGWSSPSSRGSTSPPTTTRRRRSSAVSASASRTTSSSPRRATRA